MGGVAMRWRSFVGVACVSVALGAAGCDRGEGSGGRGVRSLERAATNGVVVVTAAPGVGDQVALTKRRCDPSPGPACAGVEAASAGRERPRHRR